MKLYPPFNLSRCLKSGPGGMSAAGENFGDLGTQNMGFLRAKQGFEESSGGSLVQNVPTKTYPPFNLSRYLAKGGYVFVALY